MAHAVRQECARLQREIAELRGVVAPVTERFCSVETKIKQLEARVQGFQSLTAQQLRAGNAAGDDRAEMSLVTRVSIGVYGPPGHGKSTLVNAIIGRPDLLAPGTRRPLVVVPAARGSRPCMRLPDGKAIAGDEAGVRRVVAEMAAAGCDSGGAMPRLHVDLDEYFADAAPPSEVPWCIIDHPPTDHATRVRFTSAALNALSPVDFVDDVVFYVVDARVLGTQSEVDCFDQLLYLHPEEKAQLVAASSFASTATTATGDGSNGASAMQPPPPPPREDEMHTVTAPTTRRRLLAGTYFFLTHVDAFPDSESVLARGEFVDSARAQASDDAWTATHGQPCPPCGSAAFALRRFGMLAEFVFGAAVSPARIVCVSGLGAARCKAVLGLRNVNVALAQREAQDGFVCSSHARGNGSTRTTSPPPPASGSRRRQAEQRADEVHCIYEFAEWFLGPKFMHRADLLPYEELSRIARNFAVYRAAVASGARALDTLLSCVLHNLAQHFFASASNAAAEMGDSLESARALGDAIVATELRNACESEALLVGELAWVRAQIGAVQAEARGIPDRAVRLVEARLRDFCGAWLVELRDVVARKPLEWFKSRQIATVRDIQAALARYDAFADQFAVHHRYLVTRMSAIRAADAAAALAAATASAHGRRGGGAFDLITAAAAAPDPGSSAFLNENLDLLYAAAIKSRAERLHEVNRCIAHHLRDDLLVFIREVAATIAAEQRQWLADFSACCRVPVAKSRSRFFQNPTLSEGAAAGARQQQQQQHQSPLSAGHQRVATTMSGTSAIDRSLHRIAESLGGGGGAGGSALGSWASGGGSGVFGGSRASSIGDCDDADARLFSSPPVPDMAGCELVAESVRVLNNFCREIVDPVTAAQAELVQLDEAEAAAAADEQQFGGSASSGRIGGGGGGGASSTSMSALEQLRIAKEETAAARERMRKQSERGANNNSIGGGGAGGGGGSLRHAFIVDAWQLALFSLKLEQVAQFDLEPFVATIAGLTAAAVDALAELSETLSIGIEEHAEIVSELRDDQAGLAALRATLPRVHDAITVGACGRYAAALAAQSSDPAILRLQRRLDGVRD